MRTNSLLLAALMLMWFALSWAAPDPVQLAWLDRQPPVRHWDNVEGAPLWLGGVEPRYSRRHGLHLVTLSPGASVQLRVAAGARLRLLSAEDELAPGDLESGWSDGSGLFLSMPLQQGPDAASLLADTNAGRAGVVRITRPAGRADSLAVALFVSRDAAPVRAASYRDVVAMPQLPQLRLAGAGSAVNFRRLEAGQSVTLPLHGATRYRLESRLALPATGEPVQQRYRITTRLDGKPWQVLEFETGLEGAYPVSVNGCFAPIGRQMSGYLDMPAGSQHLELHSNAPVYLRLLGQPVPDDYLWDANRSLHHVALQQRSGVTGSIWDLNGKEVLRTLEAGDPAWPERQRSLLRLLEDNAWRDGGLLGSLLAGNQARRYPDDAAMRRFAERARWQHMTWRDLLPVSLKTPDDLQFAWFRTPALADGVNDTVVAQGYAGSLAAAMPGGYLHGIPTQANGRHTYRVPDRPGPTQLRLGVVHAGVTAPVRIYVQYDDDAPRELLLTQWPDIPPVDWRPGRAEAAVAVMDRAHATRGHTLAGPFATRRHPAPLVDVGLVELPLPREVRQVHIWRESQPGPAMHMALQYRAGKVYRYSGTAYRSLLQGLGPQAVYRQLQAALAGGPHEPAADRLEPALLDDARDLYNQWLPLLRLLHSRQRRFVAGRPPVPHDQPEHDRLGATQTQALQQAARKATQAGDLVAALEAWTDLWHGTRGTAREQAALARISVLEQLGEHFLAEQQLRRYLVNGASDALRAQALAQLLARYRRAGNDEARLNVLAYSVIREPKPADLRELAQVLLALGRTNDALQLGLALPPAERPVELLLQASFVAGWWTLFDELLADLPGDTEHHRWAGLRAQAQGNHAQALADWAQAGTAGAALRARLLEGLEIRAQLGAAEAAERRQAVSRWETWQSRLPGPHRWQDAGHLVMRYAGVETLHAIALDRDYTAFRATPAEPLTLQVHGPARLRIAARAVHATADGPAVDAWLQVSDGKRQKPFPLSGNRPAQGMRLAGRESSFPGQAEKFEYRVAAGLHVIHITPAEDPLLLQLAMERPLLPLAVLPPLVPATAQAALQGELGNATGPATASAESAGIEVVHQCGTTRLALDRPRTGFPAPATARRTAPKTPASRAAQETAGVYHTVRGNETLYSIARQHGLNYHQLAVQNAIAPPYVIKAGQRLRIGTGAGTPAQVSGTPGVPDATTGVYHTVRDGETLYSIARKYGLDYRQLAGQNAITPPYAIQTGQRLRNGSGAALAADVRPDVPAPGPIRPPANFYHTVSDNETLYSIARQHGLDYRQLAGLNAIAPPYLIRTGQRLRIGTDPAVQEAVTAGREADARVVARMRGILWLAEHDATHTTAMVAAGETLFQQHPDVPGMQKLLRRLRRGTAWEPVPAVHSSAGVRVVEVSQGQPGHPATRTRQALLPGMQADEQLLSGYETLVFAVDQPGPGQFHFDLALADLAAAPGHSMQVAVQLDDGAEEHARLTPAAARQTVTQRVPAGRHVLRVRIVDPVLSQYLRVLVREDGHPADGAITTRPGRRTWHIATRDEPVIVYLEGPTRLRIDELHEGFTSYRYRNLDAGWQRVQVGASAGRDRSLLRIYRLAPRPPAMPVPARLPGQEPQPVPSLFAGPPGTSAWTERPAIDRFAPGGQEDGTWSLQSSLVRRRNLDEESTGDEGAENFAELGATHRYLAQELGTWFRTDLLTRVREDGGPTLGLRERIDIRRADWPADVSLGASLFTQRPDSGTGREWAATLRGSASRTFDITSRTSHRPALRLFQRWLSMDENTARHPEKVDQDLFTDYKHDHKRGLGLRETLIYRPWLDSTWSTGLGLMTNEDLNPFDPDHVEVTLGARQLLGDWQAMAGYRGRRYFSDGDRGSSSTRHRYQLALDWLGWRSDRHGLQGRVQLDWDDSSSEFSGLFSIAWVRSNGRFYRDFRPAETGFRELRERRLREQRFGAGAGGDGER